MTDSPYRVVVEALAAQSVAISRLAREIKIEFTQYQDAVSKRDNARANALAAAINERTARLSAAADELEASVPNAEVGGGPAEPPGFADNTLPGTGVGGGPVRPGRPTDPDFGIDAGGGVTGKPDQGLPGGPPEGDGKPPKPPTIPGRPGGGPADPGKPDEAPPESGPKNR